MDTKGMDKWDKAFSKHEVVEEFPEENGITKNIEYLMMDNRDMVQVKKIWKEYNGNQNSFLSISKSVEHSSHPPQKKVVRAEMIFSGIFLYEDSPGQTGIYMINFSIINNADLKIKAGADLD